MAWNRTKISLLMQAGYTVVGLDIQPTQDEQSDEVLRRFQKQYTTLEVDISDEQDVKTAIEKAQTFLGGRINSLVNNAGIALSGMSEEPGQRIASYKKFLSVNLIGEPLHQLLELGLLAEWTAPYVQDT